MKLNARTISDISLPGSNSFGVVRLFAAILVVYSHATGVVHGDAIHEPLKDLTGFTLGWHSVNMFFCLSGLLIAASIERSRSLIQFLWARFLRLYPALITIIFFMCAVGVFFTDESISFLNVLNLAARTVILFGDSATLPGVFVENPISGVVNSPIWTLRFEVICYLFLAATFPVVSLLQKKFPGFISMKPFSLLVLIACGAHMTFFYDEMTATFVSHLARFIFAFFLGVAAWQWREALRPNLLVMVILSVLTVGLIAGDIKYAPIQIFAASYLALWIGSLSLGALARFTDEQDYSYGVYITAFPIQQAVYVMMPGASPLVNFLISVVLALFASILLWNMIEKPALKLKRFPLDQILDLSASDKRKSPTSRLKVQ